jgi:hypothetical protein
VLGVECSNHSVPTIFFNDLAQSLQVGLFHARDFLKCVIFMAACFKAAPAFKEAQLNAGLVVVAASIVRAQSDTTASSTPSSVKGFST